MKHLWPAITVVFFASSLLFFQIQSISFRACPASIVAQELKYIPNGAFLKGAVLSFDELCADLLWLKSITYFSDELKQSGSFKWIYLLLDTTTDLDPYFEEPYEFGGITLSALLNNHQLGTQLLQKGINHVPKHHQRYYYLLFFTGFNYMYYDNDLKKAATYLEQAASYPNSPSYLPLLVARLYANTNEPEYALPFLKEMRDSATSELQREKLNQRIEAVQTKVNLKTINDALEKFHQDTGTYPTQLETLTKLGYLTSLPNDPSGATYFLDPITHLARSSKDHDSLELRNLDKSLKTNSP